MADLSSSFFPFILITGVSGIIGNILSVCVLVRKELVKSIASQELLGLAFFDTLLLLTFIGQLALDNFIEAYYEMTDEEAEKFLEHFFNYVLVPVNRIAYTGSVYTTILISRDRYLAICLPLQSLPFLTLRRTRTSILLILLFSVLINLPRWFEGFVEKSFRDIYMLCFYLIWFLVIYAIPFISIGVFNYRIYKEVKLMRGIREGMGATNANSTGQDASLSKMLLVVVAVFLALNTISFIIGAVALEVGTDISILHDELVYNLPIVINSSSNILIYAVFGKQFRSEFGKMIRIVDLNCLACWTKQTIANVEEGENRNTVLESESKI